MNNTGFRRKSQVLAFANIFAFGIQAIFALFMLHLFSPLEIGEYSVISQISAFWMVIALAQTPLSMLANKSASASQAAIKSWTGSLYRALLIYPIIFIALYYCELSFWPSILWASLITFFQITWLLTQSYTLQSGTEFQQALVRILPPLSALTLSVFGAYLRDKFGWDGPTLIVSAIIGYAIGAIWFVRVFTTSKTQEKNHLDAELASPQADNRSAILRMLHSFTDALLITLIATTWHRLYGPIETGLMMAILRVLSFLPVLVWSAWTQILMTRPTENSNIRIFRFNINPWSIGAIATACILMISTACAFAVNNQILNTNWQGILPYIIPVSIWQAATCFSAAFSHRPFQTQKSRLYSWICIGLNIIQILALITPFAAALPLGKLNHIYLFCGIASLSAISLTAWLSKLKSN